MKKIDNVTMEKEVRNFNVRAAVKEDSRTVQGVAVVFDSWSNDMGFFERIDPQAITQDTIDNSDIFALLNHDQSRGVLARSNKGQGSLRLSLSDYGLSYEFEAPKTALGDELLEYLNRGDLSNSSFCFTIAEGGEQWSLGADGKHYRTITKIDRLYDVSPVFTPAYSATTSTRRSYDEAVKLINDLNAEEEKIKNL